jgi:hypothetical protein
LRGAQDWRVRASDSAALNDKAPEDLKILPLLPFP